MKGAVYVQEVKFVSVSNSTFMYNDPGYVWNDFQVVGLIDNNEYS